MVNEYRVSVGEYGKVLEVEDGHDLNTIIISL